MTRPATSSAFCFEFSKTYSKGYLKAVLSSVSSNLDGITSNFKPWISNRKVYEEFIAHYNKNISKPCKNTQTFTIFRRISHLLGELLARMTLCADKTSKSGSNILAMKITRRAREQQKSLATKFGGKQLLLESSLLIKWWWKIKLIFLSLIHYIIWYSIMSRRFIWNDLFLPFRSKEWEQV